MTPTDLLALLRARPFRSFRVVTTDGTTYEVQHPELVMVAIGSAVIGYPDHNNPAVAERYDIVSMPHIIRLEPEASPVGQP